MSGMSHPLKKVIIKMNSLEKLAQILNKNSEKIENFNKNELNNFCKIFLNLGLLNNNKNGIRLFKIFSESDIIYSVYNIHHNI